MASMHDDRSSGFRRGSFGSAMTGIDNVEDPQALLTFLDDVAELDEVRTAKQRATEALALQPGDRVLEIGCGTGVDALGHSSGSGAYPAWIRLARPARIPWEHF
jgi:uncharacterized protein YerC